MKYHFSLTKKCLCCLLGLAVSGFGVAFSTYPDLGTSPISGLPYVMTFIYPLSFGTWTVLVNCLFIVIQAALLGKKFGWAQLLQIPAVTVFGFFIDLGMWLAGCVPLESYAARAAEQVAGCAILAAGISFALIADVTYMPGEGLINVIAKRWRLDFGKTKIAFDASLVVLSFATSLIFCGEIIGIREGTLIAVLMVGSCIRQFRRPFRFFKRGLVKA